MLNLDNGEESVDLGFCFVKLVECNRFDGSGQLVDLQVAWLIISHVVLEEIRSEEKCADRTVVFVRAWLAEGPGMAIESNRLDKMLCGAS